MDRVRAGYVARLFQDHSSSDCTNFYHIGAVSYNLYKFNREKALEILTGDDYMHCNRLLVTMVRCSTFGLLKIM